MPSWPLLWAAQKGAHCCPVAGGDADCLFAHQVGRLQVFILVGKQGQAAALPVANVVLTRNTVAAGVDQVAQFVVAQAQRTV